MNEAQLWQDLGGAPAIRAMVKAFYAKIPTDPVLGPMYPEDDMLGAEQRLADFLCFRLGGDQTYLRKRGHPRLRMRHMPFEINTATAEHWLKLMREAMQESKIPTEPAQELDAFFAQVAYAMRNQED